MFGDFKRRGPVDLLNSAYVKYRDPETLIKVRARIYELTGHSGIGDPLQLIDVVPEDIGWWIDSSWLNKPFPRNIAVRGGDWDKKAEPFEELPVYRMFVEHFEEGIPWKQTAAYNERSKNGSYTDNQLETWDVLFERISEDGYRTQDELIDNDQDDNSHGGILNEINICIGRRGNLIAKHGLHRIAIAKILNLDTVPVWVRVRHEEWQELRDVVWEADNTKGLNSEIEEYINHPDMNHATKNFKNKYNR